MATHGAEAPEGPQLRPEAQGNEHGQRVELKRVEHAGVYRADPGQYHHSFSAVPAHTTDDAGTVNESTTLPSPPYTAPNER